MLVTHSFLQSLAMPFMNLDPLSVPLLTTLFPCVLTVSAPELKRLKRRYEKLDVDKNGRISAEEFMYVFPSMPSVVRGPPSHFNTLCRSMPELANNPLVERIIDTIDADKSGDVDFQEFIMALSIFIRGDKESKLRCM